MKRSTDEKRIARGDGTAAAMLVLAIALAGCDVTMMGSRTTGDAGPSARDAAMASEDDANSAWTGGDGSVPPRDDAHVEPAPEDGGVIATEDGGAMMNDGGPMPMGDGGVPTEDETGWSEFPPAAGARLVYVSSSTGDDGNDGLSPANAVRSLSRGTSLLRGGNPDQLLLRRGDTWMASFSDWTRSGRSPSEPMVISSYGEGARPRLRTGDDIGWHAFHGTVSNLAIVGIHFDATDRGASSPVGIRRTIGGTFFHIEDCYFEGYQNDITIENEVHDVTIRRSIIVDAHPRRVGGTVGHSQGVYLSNVHGLLVEENVFDGNGWRAGVDGGTATIFNHGMYVQADCSDVVVRGNVFANSSSHGAQVRPGGIVEDNLFAGNPIGLSFGLVYGGHAPTEGGVTGMIVHNVIRRSDDITGSLPRGIGMQIGNIRSASICENVISHYASAETYGSAIHFDAANGIGINDLEVCENVVHRWYTPLSVSGFPEGVTVRANVFDAADLDAGLFSFLDGFRASDWTFVSGRYDSARASSRWMRIRDEQLSLSAWVTRSGETGSLAGAPTYVDAARDLATFQATITSPRGSSWLEGARLQARGQWRREYTAEAITTYLRAGFAAR